MSAADAKRAHDIFAAMIVRLSQEGFEPLALRVALAAALVRVCHAETGDAFTARGDIDAALETSPWGKTKGN